MKRRVAVLGAGASGLTTAKALLEEGHEPVVFEARTAIGGVWRYSESASDATSPAYRSLRANTSRRLTAFSDHPFPAGTPDFPSREQMLAYLEGYADRFALRRHIRFGAALEHAAPESGGAWRVTSAATGAETFSALVVCNGRYRAPVIPRFPGQEEFRGEIIHSSVYRRPEPFQGKRVVVVGAGSSAVDIAAELSAHALEVTLSTRSGAWLIPHDHNGQPSDHGLMRIGEWVPARVRNRIIRGLLEREYRRRGLRNHPALRALADLPMPHGPRIITATGLLDALARDRVAIAPGIAGLGPTHVELAGGRRIEADTVVLGTGYRFDFPFLRDVPEVGSASDLGLYRHVVHPTLANLAFVGMCGVVGPNLPVMEMQARWIASILGGKTTLPPASEMKRAIDARRGEQMKIDLIPYLDELAALIGVMPRFARRPTLLPSLILGAFSPMQYRLDGPGSLSEADVRRGLA